ncbi:MAG: lactate racemase domain-containing protein [Carboxydocellales bacterium]
MTLPLMYKVRQQMPRPRLENIAQTVTSELESGQFWAKLKPGARIAVTAGSRGIANIELILKTVVKVLQEKGAQPFILAAMGSHGGGTAAGQLKVLKSLGITESSMGVPVQATTEANELGSIQEGVLVYQNKLAADSDGIVVINRVKPHTSFQGKVESGLFKMLVVGLGNVAGATAIHNLGIQGLENYLLPLGQLIIKQTPVLFGLGIVENGFEETAYIKGFEPAELASGEGKLLQKAKELHSYLPFDQVDLLVVEEMGKVFSGTGMDTKVIGRLRIHDQPEPKKPQIKRIVVLDLVKESHGNANGIGLADFTTKQLVDKIDFKTTYTNVLTATFIQRAMIPMYFPTAKEALEAALQSLSLKPESARIVRIKNTLQLENIFISQNLLNEAKNNPALEIIGQGQNFGFHKNIPTPKW